MRSTRGSHQAILLLFLLLAVNIVVEVNSACCKPTCKQWAVSWWGKTFCADAESVCGDGTAPNPYCSYGRCNVFGCNCDGGCRSRRKRAASDDSDASTEAEEVVNTLDRNHDGCVDKNEVIHSPLRSGRNSVNILRDFADFDVNQDGCLGAEEIDQ